MRNKVLERPLPNASLPRNAFDRGFDIKYNFSSGMALPVFCEPVLGNTQMRINRRCMIRAAQLQTAAMVRNSFNIDFFFVPFRQLWSYYGVSRTGTKDYYSSKLMPTQDVSVTTLPYFKTAQGGAPHDLYAMVMGLKEASVSPLSNPDIHGYRADYGCLRLLDLLNYGVTSDYSSNTVGFQPMMDTLPSMSMFKLLAYQKVWYDHYRLTNYVKNEPKAYNVDGLVNNSGGIESPDGDWLMKMGTMHYVPYRKDYFQNIYPSLNYAPINQMGSSYFAVPNNVVGAEFNYQWTSGTSNPYTKTYVKPNSAGIGSGSQADGVPLPLVNMTHTSTAGGVFTAQTVRALFALDKMTRLAAYAPKHVADQFEVRFGFRPKGEDMNESVRIGSFVSDISIGEVVSTAETNSGYETEEKTTQLGAIGGRAFSVAAFERDIVYKSPEDGLVIGIAYALPRISYDAGGIDNFNMVLDSNELPQPEFMDLGLQPLRQNEFFHNPSPIPDNLKYNNRILGYQPMYSSWKIGKSRNHGLFVRGLNLSIFSTHTRFDYMNDIVSYTGDGVSANYFYATPNDLNPIFAQHFDGTQDTDQFFGQIEFKFDVVQNFSIHGQPRI